MQTRRHSFRDCPLGAHFVRVGWTALLAGAVFTTALHRVDAEVPSRDQTGTVAAAGKKDAGPHAVTLWDANNGNRLHRFEGHTDSISCVAFSPDGRHLVTGSRDNTAAVWDLATGQRLHTLSAHTKGLTAVAFSPDGTRILTGSRDSTAILWDAATGGTLQAFRAHVDGLTALAFSADGTRILTGSRDNSAMLWDAASGNRLQTFLGHTRPITSLAFSPTAREVLTGSLDTRAILWDVNTGRGMQTFYHPNDPIQYVFFTAGGRQVTIVSPIGTAKSWDTGADGIQETPPTRSTDPSDRPQPGPENVPPAQDNQESEGAVSEAQEGWTTEQIGNTPWAKVQKKGSDKPIYALNGSNLLASDIAMAVKQKAPKGARIVFVGDPNDKANGIRVQEVFRALEHEGFVIEGREGAHVIQEATVDSATPTLEGAFRKGAEECLEKGVEYMVYVSYDDPEATEDEHEEGQEEDEEDDEEDKTERRVPGPMDRPRFDPVGSGDGPVLPPWPPHPWQLDPTAFEDGPVGPPWQLHPWWLRGPLFSPDGRYALTVDGFEPVHATPGGPAVEPSGEKLDRMQRRLAETGRQSQHDAQPPHPLDVARELRARENLSGQLEMAGEFGRLHVERIGVQEQIRAFEERIAALAVSMPAGPQEQKVEAERAGLEAQLGELRKQHVELERQLALQIDDLSFRAFGLDLHRQLDQWDGIHAAFASALRRHLARQESLAHDAELRDQMRRWSQQSARLQLLLQGALETAGARPLAQDTRQQITEFQRLNQSLSDLVDGVVAGTAAQTSAFGLFDRLRGIEMLQARIQEQATRPLAEAATRLHDSRLLERMDDIERLHKTFQDSLAQKLQSPGAADWPQPLRDVANQLRQQQSQMQMLLGRNLGVTGAQVEFLRFQDQVSQLQYEMSMLANAARSTVVTPRQQLEGSAVQSQLDQWQQRSAALQAGLEHAMQQPGFNGLPTTLQQQFARLQDQRTGLHGVIEKATMDSGRTFDLAAYSDRLSQWQQQEGVLSQAFQKSVTSMSWQLLASAGLTDSFRQPEGGGLDQLSQRLTQIHAQASSGPLWQSAVLRMEDFPTSSLGSPTSGDIGDRSLSMLSAIPGFGERPIGFSRGSGSVDQALGALAHQMSSSRGGTPLATDTFQQAALKVLQAQPDLTQRASPLARVQAGPAVQGRPDGWIPQGYQGGAIGSGYQPGATGGFISPMERIGGGSFSPPMGNIGGGSFPSPTVLPGGFPH